MFDCEAVFLTHRWHPVLLEVPFAGGAEPGLFAFSDVNLEVFIDIILSMKGLVFGFFLVL